jgi:lipopolysaccharide/colanic/teichoic acid biosynthesis glycosyltransferase
VAKRIFDIVFSFIGLAVLSPVFIVLAIWIATDSRGGVFYRQKRVGKGGCDFLLFKFRTMHTDADKKGLITVGNRDPRVTNAGYYLRKYKLDELPQLLNVLFGDMSLVGPRPEVRKYVDLYSPEQLKVLSVKPGITDFASIEFSNENEILAAVADPNKVYVEEIMPAKLKLNMRYIRECSLSTDFRIILMTIRKIIG